MTKDFNVHKRPWRRQRREKRDHAPAAYSGSFIPRVDRKLRKFFDGIGVPEKAAFIPDDFQLEAIEKIKSTDVIVSAPTGSGKTWIAAQAIKEMLTNGRRSWYASPLKALSNSKYQEFGEEFGKENVGILTGDRKENTDAKIIVGTTEILRNHLYDSMHTGEDFPADLVIMDEAHYLGDIDRGVVWEEVMIYLPARVRLLLLSATIQNDKEIAQWLSAIRKTPCTVVHHEKRPVPIYPLYLFPNGEIVPLSGFDGISPKIRDFLVHSQGDKFRRSSSGRLPYGRILDALGTFNLLPAIFFLKSRDDCNSAVFTCGHRELSTERRQALDQRISELLAEYPFLEKHPQLSWVLNHGVGAHHGGQLLHWKIVVEKLMNEGYLDAIFSTSTVAAGVNFPARTVVLIQSDRFNGHEFANLTATDLHQMTGRAGRRGKDNIGFALVVPGLHQDPQLIHELKDSPPEPLVSQIRINFSMTLNLLLSHRPVEVKDLLDRSFAAFQNVRSGSGLQGRWERMLEALEKALPKGKCDPSDPYAVIENMNKRAERGRKARRRADAVWRSKRAEIYRKYLTPGRLFQHKDKGFYVVLDPRMDHDQPGCRAHKLGRNLRMKKGRILLRDVPLDRVKRIFDSPLILPANASLAKWQQLFDAVAVENLRAIEIPIPNGETRTISSGNSAGTTSTLSCVGCPNHEVCHLSRNKGVKRALEEFRRLEPQIEGVRGGLWLSFQRHIRFLRETHFVTADDQLTADGYWASKLRVDQPLLIAEAIRKGALEARSPEILAGSIAPFVWDRIQEVELARERPSGLGDMEAAFDGIRTAIGDLRSLKTARGFTSPSIQFWPAAALYMWAKGIPWERLCSFWSVDEGDMASLIVRTIDHLRQVHHLVESHPKLAVAAATAIELLSKEPVVMNES